MQQWYENELGWATVPGAPVRLATGLRFDVLDVPAEAGYAALRHLGPGSPVALHGGRRTRGERMRFLVAVGSADELPGLLDWLEWGPSRWTSGRSARAGASRLHRHLLFDRRECRGIHRVRVVHRGPVRKRPIHGGRV